MEGRSLITFAETLNGKCALPWADCQARVGRRFALRLSQALSNQTRERSPSALVQATPQLAVATKAMHQVISIIWRCVSCLSCLAPSVLCKRAALMDFCLVALDAQVCVYSMICSNRDELWRLKPGEDWECRLDREGYEQLQDYLLRA